MDGIIRWDNLQRVLGEFAVELRNRYQDNLIRDGKIAGGDLLNNMEYKVESGDRSVEVSLRLEDYWKWVENGRGPGKFPPPDRIMEWIRVKPVIPDNRTGRLPTERQLAFLIGRKISEEGIKPGHQLREAVSDIMGEFENRIDEAISRDIDAGFDVLFSSFFNGN